MHTPKKTDKTIPAPAEIDRSHLCAPLFIDSLAQAIAKEEINLHYQPIVDIKTNKILTVEALACWTSPTLGEISPMQFIEAAEEMGIIMLLGDWILKKACCQLINWQKQGIHLGMTVNISAKQLNDPHFATRVEAVFKDLAFDPKQYYLAFEVTEKMLVENLDRSMQILRTLKTMGLKIYLDDFGSGATPLSYLDNLPLDALKIDSMFIRSITKDQNIKIMIKGMLALGKGLGLTLIAEGVETQKQLLALQHLGCCQAQGYLLYAPVGAKKIEELMGK